ncbi:allantoinase AllB [Wenjunlia tyrosinilytica]|uniref:allantoinase n=1 Tax=Wenjunlia tyrosinilytica TaxID=1544741 RepID=A0A917ZUB3_9ACTN|nr:allantoinase AllB [Wenjunlia tyrosinilytica]GGO92535.1 allantoinase [Wenjunlia tyrosinilytica]
MPIDLVLRSTRVITPDGERPAAIAVADGRIAQVLAYDAPPPDGARVVELGDDALMPGVVDTHVHINEPGRTEWEGFASATRAAAAGGVTTLIDMPLNSIPPTTTVDALAIKRDAALGRVHVDVGFWGGAVPGNVRHLEPLHHRGVFGFKCFLLHSGVEEFPQLPAAELAEAMEELARIDALLIVHAEDAQVIDSAPRRPGRAYADFLASRPREAENTAIEHLIPLARRLGTRVHILHLSSSDALPLIEAARREGVAVTAETCPHYLTLTAQDVPDGATEFKCCPPIREAANQDRLWEGLAAGTIDCVVSDHSPCTPELKRFDTGDFAQAWGGIASVQLGLAAIWTEASSRGHTLSDVARWMSAAPARLAGLARKGAITHGNDADFAVFAPEESFTVDPAALHHRNPVSAYAGRTLNGVVRSTWLRGRLIAENGKVREPAGRLIERGES